MRTPISAVSIVSLVLACSGSSSSATASPEDACDRAATAYCDKLEECAPFLVTLGPGDRARCIDRFKINCVPAFSASGTSATPDGLAQCAIDVRGATCEDITSRTPPASCKTQPGSLADGAACGADAQCRGRLCRQAPGSDCGACSSPAPLGAACERNEDCDSGLSCAARKCVAYAKAGTACGPNQPCVPTLGCNVGTCAPPLAAGSACVFKQDENPCDAAKGFYCHPTTKICTAIATATAGGACGFSADGITLCSNGGDCKGAPPAATGTCQAPASDGAACNDATGPKCSAPARCINGVCKITDPATCK